MIKKSKTLSLFTSAFTMMELVFVIVIVGLLATFGVEFMVQAYKNYIFSAVNNRLQNESATTVEFIAKRLSHRIKDSVIARDLTTNTFVPIQSVGGGGNYTVLEWVGVDVDGWRGSSLPLWSGIIDVDADIGFTNRLTSPETNTTTMNALISSLSNTNSDINDSALYFIGSNSDINSSYGWNGTALTTQTGAATHPIRIGTNTNQFFSNIGGVDFSGVDVYEYYKHSWTAYAIVHSDDGNLTLHYDYQPWNGDTYLLQTDDNQTKSVLIMQNVSTFQYKAVGTLIKIQICVESEFGREYSICKEKTIF